MIITQQKWDNYFGAEASPGFENSKRLESLSISLFNVIFPNIEKYEDITIDKCIEKYEEMLMEQNLFFRNNLDLLDGSITTDAGFSLGKWSKSSSNDMNISNSDNAKRLSPNAYNLASECGWVYLGLNNGNCRSGNEFI